MTNPLRKKHFLAETLYDGTGSPPLSQIVITCADGLITALTPFDLATHGAKLPRYPIVTPGLIDIQINGANDVQFNDQSDVAGLRRIAEGAEKGGTAWILPTFLTAHGRGYEAAINAARAAIAQGVAGILGLHLEGPFLSPTRPGIHDKTAIRPLDSDDLALLCQPFPGPLLVTLAPEEAPAGTITALNAAGVCVFAGHSEASHAQMQSAIAEGLRGATHLFNAMSQIQGREPGVVGSVLESDSLFAGIIADGHHVHWRNIALAIRLMSDRLCLVTDAMCTLAGTRQSFDMHGEKISLTGGRLSNADGTLAGAHVAMDTCLQNVITRGLAAPELAVRMASWNPARALGVDDRLGKVQIGYLANLSLFDAQWQAQGVLRA